MPKIEVTKEELPVAAHNAEVDRMVAMVTGGRILSESDAAVKRMKEAWRVKPEFLNRPFDAARELNS